MTEEIIIKRLTLIKHLYKLGLKQASLSEIISYSSILSLHDALDMFMILCAEKKSVTKAQYLMQYFDSIPELTLKASVDKINKRRNGLKHSGIIPGKIEIDDSCSVAKFFLEENTQIIFNKTFADISLYDLIIYDQVRELLKSAEGLAESEQYEGASEEIAKAYFHLLIIEQSLNKNVSRNPWYDYDPVPIIRGGKFYTKAFELIVEDQDKLLLEPKTEDGYVEVNEGVAALASNYNRAFSYIFQSLKIFSLGLDYKKYNHFMSTMPQVYSYHGETDKYDIYLPRDYSVLTKENINFSLDFVMEFACKLQEFKY